MARRIVHQLIDDLDGTVLEVGEGETLAFSLDGIAYEIDLTSANAEALRAAFAPYIAAGRTISTARSSGSSAGSRAPRRRHGQVDYGPIRQWASENGYQISQRGRVPAAVIEAYQAAN